MLFQLHTALYWKANKRYAETQNIKPLFEVESKHNTEKQVMIESSFSFLRTLELYIEYQTVTYLIYGYFYIQTMQESRIQHLNCYSTSCRKDSNYCCYSIDCPKKRGVDAPEVQRVI